MNARLSDNFPGVEIDSAAVVRLHHDRAKLWRAIRPCGLFLLAGIGLSILGVGGLWAISQGYITNDKAGRLSTADEFGLALIAGIPLFVLFTGALIPILRRLYDDFPDVAFGPAGLYDRWLLKKIILWEEIDLVRYVPSERIEMPGSTPHNFRHPGRVEIEYRDDAGFLAQVSVIDRIWIAGYRKGRGRARVSPLTGDCGIYYSPSAADIVWLMARHCKAEGLPSGYLPQHPVLADLAPDERAVQAETVSMS